MCGRFDLIASAIDLQIFFTLQDAPFIAPRYNIAPTQPIAAVRLNQFGMREFTHFHWGLVPRSLKLFMKRHRLRIHLNGDDV